MHFTPIFTYTLLSLAPLVARADLELDADDISAACSSVCRPIQELSQTCDVDLDDGNSSTEDNLQLQCICTNNSFDVGSIAPLCASCMQQNPTSDDDGDDDNNDTDTDTDDINEIVSRCGFSSTSYAASQSTTGDNIVVAATRPTAASQLTTTITGGVGGTTATTTGTASVSTVTGTTGTGTTVTGTTVTGTSAAATSTDTAVSGAAGMEPFINVWTIMAVGVAAVGALTH